MSILKRIAPDFLKQSFIRDYYYNLLFLGDLIANYYYDFRRFLKYSATNNPYGSKQRHQGRITAHYHQIEKGLSLKNTRVGFGKEVVRHLINMLESYQQQYGSDELSQIALNTLLAYYQFNQEQGVTNPELYARLISLKQGQKQFEGHLGGGVIEVSKAQIQQRSTINFREFANSRYSIRQFDPDRELSLEVIKNAVTMAIKTPSVCNRQTWKVFAFSDRNSKTRVLSHQNGNRGFGDSASHVLIVTCDLNYFMNASERNQCFVDGGMFAMSLVYALHSLGVGTCCLNWSADYKRDLALKQEAQIEPSESIVMLIAVGQLPDNLTVASSPRKNLEQVLFLK